MIKIILPYPNSFTESYISSFLQDREVKFLFLVEQEQKIYKKNITLNYSELLEGEIWCIGAEVLKQLFRVSGVTKYNGTKQKLYNKETDSDITVGVLIDPSIIQIYPHKEPQVVNAIKSLLNSTEKTQIAKDYLIATSPQEADQIIDKLEKVDKVVIDLETSSLYPHKGGILLYVFSTEPHNGFVIPTELVNESRRSRLSKIFASKHLIFHNLKFDYKWLKFNGYEMQTNLDMLDDTMLMAYCIDENEAKGLKELALKYTDLGDYDKNLQLEKKKLCKSLKLKVSEFSYDMLPSEVLGEYAVRDGDATSQIYKIFVERLQRPKHYVAMLDYSLHLIDVELNGGFISTDRLSSLEAEYLDKINKLENEFSNYLPEGMSNFNPRSPKQVADVLYEHLGFEIMKRTAAGAPSTDEESLWLLKKAHKHPFIDAILDYRKVFKFYTTYILSIKENLDADSRIRTNFNVTGTVSGRLSSSGTINFQNIPSKDKSIKKLFVPANSDWWIFQCDLKTAEVWMAAYLSGDKFLQEVFLSGGDFHGHVAKRVFNLDCEAGEVKQKYPELRQAAKAITFGIMYLAGPNKIAQELDITKSQAKIYIDAYFKEARELKIWLEEQYRFACDYGYLKSIFGRIRRVPEVSSSNQQVASHAAKSAVNFAIQSPTNDLNLIAFCRTMDRVEKEGLDFKPFTLVHDSMVAEVKDIDTAKKVKDIFYEEINKILPRPFAPIGIDVELGKSWGELNKTL